jgi:hypothetical protein
LSAAEKSQATPAADRQARPAPWNGPRSNSTDFCAIRGLDNLGAVPSFFRRKCHHRIVQLGRNCQPAIQRLFRPFPPKIESVFHHTILYFRRPRTPAAHIFPERDLFRAGEGEDAYDCADLIDREAAAAWDPVPVSYQKRVENPCTECEQMNGDSLKLQRNFLVGLTSG